MLENEPLPFAPPPPPPLQGAAPLPATVWPALRPPPLPFISPVPMPLRVWPVFVAVAAVIPVMLGVWMVAFIVWFAIHAGLAPMAPQDSQASVQEAMKQPLMLIPVMALISLGNAGIALTGAALSPLSVARRLALGRSAAGLGTLALFSVGTLGIGMAAMNLLHLVGTRPNQGTIKLLSDMVQQASPAQVALLGLVISLFPAVCEELLFRGYVQTRLIARWGSVLGIGISGVLFGLIHLDPVQTPAMVLVGSYLGWTAYRTKSTWTSIICHLVNNASATALSALAPQTGGGDDVTTTAQAVVMLAIGVVICGACTLAGSWLLRRKEQKAQLSF